MENPPFYTLRDGRLGVMLLGLAFYKFCTEWGVCGLLRKLEFNPFQRPYLRPDPSETHHSGPLRARETLIEYLGRECTVHALCGLVREHWINALQQSKTQPDW